MASCKAMLARLQPCCKPLWDCLAPAGGIKTCHGCMNTGGLLLIIGLMFGLLFPPMMMKGGTPVKQLTPDEANQLIKQQDAIVFDAQRRNCQRQQPHALNIPLGTHGRQRLSSWSRIATSRIIVNCQLGGRSLSACQILKPRLHRRGQPKKSGIAAWLQSNLPACSTLKDLPNG